MIWALKLATQILRKGGVFVSKVFQSRDSNTINWVCQKLFERVSVFKPDSSRSTSAEFFIVCQNYTRPASIDPRLLDSDVVFSEGVVTDNERMSLSRALGLKANGKQLREREGYTEFGD